MSLTAWILALLVASSPTPVDTLRPWAEAISAQCLAAQVSSATCARFASQACVESRFATYVLDGRCNDPAWRANLRGCHVHGGWCPCDSGIAAGPWQVHGGDIGVALGELRDPVRGTAAAWEYWRRAPGAWSTWRAAERHATWWLSRSP